MDVIRTSLKNPDIKVVEYAAEILKRGGLVVYPTDTAYGLGGNALNMETIKKVYETKGREFNKPTHIIVNDWKMIKRISHPNRNAKLLFDKFLPGPLTIILNKKKVVPNILTSNKNTVGVRIPDCKITRLISSLIDFPYTTPSANKSGGTTPYSAEDVIRELDLKKVDLIIDCGSLPKNRPSTMIDLTTMPVKILREGPITTAELKKILKDIETK